MNIQKKSLPPQVAVSLLGTLLPYLSRLWLSMRTKADRQAAPKASWIALWASVVVLGAILYSLLKVSL